MRALSWLSIAGMVMGCPKANGPGDDPIAPATVEPTASAPAPSSAAPEDRLRGGWTLQVSSDAAGLNPDAVDTPEARAKMFFDHRARVEGGVLVIDHGTLKDRWAAEMPLAKELERLVLESDWDALAAEPSEGGTVFSFTVARGGVEKTVKTSNLDAHPELLRIVEIFKQVSGVP
jgi:hypothetical protein